MKLNKSMAVLAAGLVLAGSAAFAELPEGVSLFNETSTGLMDVSRWDDEWSVGLTTVNNQTKATFENDKVRFGVNLKFGVDQETGYNSKEIKAFLAHDEIAKGVNAIDALNANIEACKALGATDAATVIAMMEAGAGISFDEDTKNTITAVYTLGRDGVLLNQFPGADVTSVDTILKSLYGAAYNPDALDGNKYMFTKYAKIDYWVEFNPVNCLSIGLHNANETAGSYLYVNDGSISTGNMGSDGLTVGFDPLALINNGEIGSAKIYATVPFTANRAWFSGDDSNEDFYIEKGSVTTIYDLMDLTAFGSDPTTPFGPACTYIGEQKFNFGLGLDTSFLDGTIGVGVNVQDVLHKEERALGVFASLNLEPLLDLGLSLNAGFSMTTDEDGRIAVECLDMSDASGIQGNKILNISAAYKAAGIYGAVDFVTNMGMDDDMYCIASAYKDNLEKLTPNFFTREYDHYLGTACGYEINDSLKVAFAGKFLFNSTKKVNNTMGAMLGEAAETDVVHEYLLGFKPSVTWTKGNHSLNGGVQISYGSDEWLDFQFPVSYRYTF